VRRSHNSTDKADATHHSHRGGCYTQQGLATLETRSLLPGCPDIHVTKVERHSVGLCWVLPLGKAHDGCSDPLVPHEYQGAFAMEKGVIYHLTKVGLN